MQEFDQFEFFAGVGRLTEFATACGYKAVRFDILDHEPSESDSHSSNFMDLNSASGFAYLGMNSNNVFPFNSKCCLVFDKKPRFGTLSVVYLRLAALCLLRARLGNFAAHFAIKCSSFCKMNVGTSRRSACASIGYDQYESVFSSNRLLERWGYKSNSFKHRIFSKSSYSKKISGLKKLTLHCTPCHPSPQIALSHFFVLRRTCALIILVTALGGVWTLEQPSGSVLEYYPTFRWIMANIFTCGGNHAVSCLFRFRIIEIELDRINIWSVESSGKKPTFSVRALIILTSEFSMFEVVKVQWWMQHYSAPTPKRHYGYSNSAATLALDRGALKKDQRKPKEKRIRTAVVYFDKKGVKRYKGTDALRSTESLDIYISNFHLVFPLLRMEFQNSKYMQFENCFDCHLSPSQNPGFIPGHLHVPW